MGLLSWLFGTNPSSSVQRFEPSRIAHASTSTFGSDFIEIPSRKFFGQCKRSPNNQYTLAWRDVNAAGTEGGSRRSGTGRYLLLERDQIIADGRMARPNDGKVANNGVFILNDWGFSNSLSGTFSAFRPDGARILARKFKANLLNNGLATDGRFAVCQTCNSNDDHDSAILAVFDLAAGAEIACWSAASGWASFYEFSPGGETLGLGYPNLGVFRYSLAGDFLDRQKWKDARLSKGTYGDALLMAQSLIKEADGKLSPELASKLISAIERVTPDIADDKWQALALKLRGTCLETQGSPEPALECYQKALILDPKIGLKRRADQLKKAIRKRIV